MLSACIDAAAKHAGLNAGEETCPGTVQAWLVRNAVRLQKEALLFTDERSKLEGELLNGIDVVKCNSWEVCTQLLPPVNIERATLIKHGVAVCLLELSDTLPCYECSSKPRL